eukprot:scaffold1439_cov404-Prasinococcus_capsulatus_cf.AAC.45
MCCYRPQLRSRRTLVAPRILNPLWLPSWQSSGYDCVAVLVIRYFGGTELGRGGLARAYGNAAAAALALGKQRELLVLQKVRLRAPYSASGLLYKLAKDAGGIEVDERYETDALVLEFLVPDSNLAALEENTQHATKGIDVCHTSQWFVSCPGDQLNQRIVPGAGEATYELID